MDPDADTALFKIILILILIVFSAFFSSAETSFMSIDRLRLKQLVKDGNRRAKTVSRILEDESKLLSTILIGNNCVNLFASSLTTTLVYELYGNAAASVATGILTFLVLIFGEIMPKTIATRHAEKMALFYSPLISLLMTIFRPVIFIVNGFCKIIMKILHIKNDKTENTVTEEMLKTMLDMSKDEDQIEDSEHEIINNVFELNDSYAKDIMVPRNSIVGIKMDTSFQEIMDIFREERYTRLVVFDDDKENVLGIINMKDLIGINEKDFSVEKFLRNAYVVYESKKISELLAQMKKTANNMAVVLDEYGNISGILTIEDILEELIGEIQDEYDSEEENLIEVVNDDTFIVDGLTPLKEVNTTIFSSFESSESNTIGGFLIESLPDGPHPGDSLIMNDYLFEVQDIVDNRIGKIKITKKINASA